MALAQSVRRRNGEPRLLIRRPGPSYCPVWKMVGSRPGRSGLSYEAQTSRIETLPVPNGTAVANHCYVIHLRVPEFQS